MTKVLPTLPGAMSFTPRLVTSRSENNPAFGTPDQRFSRMGSRYEFVVSLEPMTEEQAMDWVDLDTEDDTCLLRVPEIEFDTGAPGAPLVDGASPTGTTLPVKGLTPFYPVRKGQWLSIVTDGTRYLYRAAAEAVANVDGEASVLLLTMLRVPHDDGDVIELADPMIEGFVTLGEDAWRIQGDDRLIWLTFTIKENA